MLVCLGQRILHGQALLDLKTGTQDSDMRVRIKEKESKIKELVIWHDICQ